MNLKTKRKCWEEVVEKINANSSVKRDWVEIKKKWTDMKSQTRKRAAHCRRERVKTGGGQASVLELNSLEEMVASLIPNCQLEGC
ncbi:myb/SANT-like DNA-binding domain-containing protein 3 [Haliotis rubra]|uniref:myb/SANT-like DNA-binding domain-containing protein 3 n=1 Tax=Haliotis rubra TaxID=36100 RepID=UPI001EE59E1F|nr:myb/SANT-like DNA-binding domain-containing protein 3 [Haliotis rubra]